MFSGFVCKKLIFSKYRTLYSKSKQYVVLYGTDNTVVCRQKSHLQSLNYLFYHEKRSKIEYSLKTRLVKNCVCAKLPKINQNALFERTEHFKHSCLKI